MLNINVNSHNNKLYNYKIFFTFQEHKQRGLREPLQSHADKPQKQVDLVPCQEQFLWVYLILHKLTEWLSLPSMNRRISWPCNCWKTTTDLVQVFERLIQTSLDQLFYIGGMQKGVSSACGTICTAVQKYDVKAGWPTS